MTITHNQFRTLILQATFRGWVQRTRFRAMRKAQITISSRYRGFTKRREFTRIRSAQIMVASYVRMWRARKVHFIPLRFFLLLRV